MRKFDCLRNGIINSAIAWRCLRHRLTYNEPLIEFYPQKWYMQERSIIYKAINDLLDYFIKTSEIIFIMRLSALKSKYEPFIKDFDND